MTAYGSFDDMPRRHYRLIMADPPWKTKAWSRKGMKKSAEQHYRTMSVEELCELPVRQIAAPNCHLFLWTTWAHMEQAFQVAKAWGFRYSSSGFIWVKLKNNAAPIFYSPRDFFIGMGKTTRKGSEPCLLFRKGSPKRLHKGIPEVIVSPVREHSRKPDAAFAEAVRYGAGPYLELFSRENRDGWDTFGDQTGKFNRQAKLAYGAAHAEAPVP